MLLELSLMSEARQGFGHFSPASPKDGEGGAVENLRLFWDLDSYFSSFCWLLYRSNCVSFGWLGRGSHHGIFFLTG